MEFLGDGWLIDGFMIIFVFGYGVVMVCGLCYVFLLEISVCWDGVLCECLSILFIEIEIIFID